MGLLFNASHVPKKSVIYTLKTAQNLVEIFASYDPKKKKQFDLTGPITSEQFLQQNRFAFHFERLPKGGYFHTLPKKASKEIDRETEIILCETFSFSQIKWLKWTLRSYQ